MGRTFPFRGERGKVRNRRASVGKARSPIWREVAPKPTPMITLTNDEVGWTAVIPELLGPHAANPKVDHP
jgi:hypothetical protein